MTLPVLAPKLTNIASHSQQVAAKKAGSEAWGDLASGSGYSSEAGMGLAELSAFTLRKGLAQMGRCVQLEHLSWIVCAAAARVLVTVK